MCLFLYSNEYYSHKKLQWYLLYWEIMFTRALISKLSFDARIDEGAGNYAIFEAKPRMASVVAHIVDHVDQNDTPP